MRFRSRLVVPAVPVAIAAACSGLLLSPLARAQDTEATATALFDSGRKLMAQHQYADACPKLAQSERLAPSGGTLINLAECYEHTGKTASAWAAWNDAAARANAAGKGSAEKNALARAAALEPTLAKLTITVAPDSNVSGLQVKRDGVPVGPGEFGSALPVDPGSHLVEASAPKKKDWSAKVDVAPKQSSAHVTVELADDVEAIQPAAPPSNPETSAAPTPASTPPETPPAGSGPWKTVAVVVAGAGVVGVALGAVFGLGAKSDNDQALQNCRTSTLCSDKGLSLTQSAKSAATASDIAFGVGAAAIAAGVVIWITAPRASAATGIRAVPVIGPQYGGLAVDTAW
jgi:hypothetical protein